MSETVTTANGRGVPTVWFAAQFEAGGFDQIAAALRKRGVRIVRLVRDRPTSLQRRLMRILYHRVVTIDDLRAGIGGPRRGEEILDLQSNETMIQLLDDAVLAGFPDDCRARMDRFRALSNKRGVEHLLEAHGIRVAGHLDAAETADHEAVRSLGLPLVIKADFGSAATGVRFATSAPEVATAVCELDPTRDSVFFQPHLVGEVRNYAGVIDRDGSVLGEVTVRQLGQIRGLRPQREVVADPALVEYGRSVCAALGITGPVDLEVIHDDGRPVLIDLNARPWGSMISMRALGLDFAGQYLQCLGLARAGEPRSPRPGETFAIYPYEVELLVSQGHGGAAVRTFAKWAVRLARWTGWRYPAYDVALRVFRRLGVEPDPGAGSTGLPNLDH